jgi:hypothetical protein
VGTPIIEEASAKPAFTTNTSGSFPDSLASKPPKPKKPERVSKVNKTNASVGSAKDRPPGSGSDSIRRSGEFGSDADLAKKNASLSDSSFNNNSGVKGSSAVNNSTKKTSSRNAAPKIVSRGVNYSGLVSKGGPDVVLTKQSVDDDTGYLSGINKLIGYLKGLVSPRLAQASSGDESDLESREIKAPRSPPKNEPLKIESVNRSGTIPKILDVTAVPSEPEEGTPVKVLVHAKAVGGVKYVNLRWSKADVTASRSDLLDVKNANKIPMIRQTGSKEDGYWSGMIPSQKAGTYVVISVEVTDGSGIAEDGPYMLRWVTKEQAMSRQASSDSKPGNRSVPSKGSKGDEMLFIESTTVTGSGHVSIRDSFQESTLAYEEDLDGTGTINMATERCVEKGNPVVNFSQRKDLAFGDGVLTGFKRFDSPSFQHGMGASITERFNTTLIEKSETGVLRNSNRSENTLAFSTEQAFEGSWNTKAEYSRFNKRMKLDQKYSGTFQTQKNIKFED